MAGSVLGGLKVKAIMYERHGKDVYRNMGRIGGKLSKSGGFKENKALAKQMGKIHGKRSKVGYTYIKSDSKYHYYRHKKTGDIHRYLITYAPYIPNQYRLEFVVDGMIMSVSKLSQYIGMDYMSVYCRLKAGWVPDGCTRIDRLYPDGRVLHFL